MDEFTSISCQFNFNSIVAWNWMKLSSRQTSDEISFLTQGKICLVQPMWPPEPSIAFLHCNYLLQVLWDRKHQTPRDWGLETKNFHTSSGQKDLRVQGGLKGNLEEENNSSSQNQGRVSQCVLLGDSGQASQRGSLSHRQRPQCEFKSTTN